MLNDEVFRYEKENNGMCESCLLCNSFALCTIIRASGRNPSSCKNFQRPLFNEEKGLAATSMVALFFCLSAMIINTTPLIPGDY